MMSSLSVLFTLRLDDRILTSPFNKFSIPQGERAPPDSMLGSLKETEARCFVACHTSQSEYRVRQSKFPQDVIITRQYVCDKVRRRRELLEERWNCQWGCRPNRKDRLLTLERCWRHWCGWRRCICVGAVIQLSSPLMIHLQFHFLT